MAGPGVPEERRLTHPVSNKDVAPFLASLAGGTLLPGFSPAAFFDDERTQEPIFYSTDKGWWEGSSVPIHGLRLGAQTFQFIPSAGAVRLFDLTTDPRETRDLSESRPDEVERLRTRVQQRIDAAEERRTAPEFGVGEATRRLLERIGYAGGDD